MDLFIQNIFANSIPVAILLLIAKRYVKGLKNRFEIVEDKQEAMMRVLFNGDYDKFKAMYERIRTEREEREK